MSLVGQVLAPAVTIGSHSRFTPRSPVTPPDSMPPISCRAKTEGAFYFLAQRSRRNRPGKRRFGRGISTPTRLVIAFALRDYMRSLLASRRAGIDWRLTTDDAQIKLRQRYPSTDG